MIVVWFGSGGIWEYSRYDTVPAARKRDQSLGRVSVFGWGVQLQTVHTQYVLESEADLRSRMRRMRGLKKERAIV